MSLVVMHGEMWARNKENIQAVPGSRSGGKGVYILYDGSMPVYVGRGNIHQRIAKARKSKRRGQHWDHFSWYALRDPRLSREVEAFLLRMLPFYLRILNRQRAKLSGSRKHSEEDTQAEPIKRPKLFRWSE